MALLIPADGGTHEVTPKNGRSFTLEELQSMVGGYIEAMSVPEVADHLLFMNEDGKRLALPYNHTATVLCRGYLRPDDVIVGNVVVCTRLEAGGPTDDESED